MGRPSAEKRVRRGVDDQPSTHFVDLTGDGRAEAVVVNDDSVWVRRNRGGDFGPHEDWTHGPFYGQHGTYFVDLTADGQADALAVNDDSVWVRRNARTRFGA